MWEKPFNSPPPHTLKIIELTTIIIQGRMWKIQFLNTFVEHSLKKKENRPYKIKQKSIIYKLGISITCAHPNMKKESGNE